ncbi:MAG: pentapeptide repeat-containing protein, partial [Devosia nanyangense]|nr:pentapeptide repeat-containing protein [Devosia nanyangense]
MRPTRPPARRPPLRTRRHLAPRESLRANELTSLATPPQASEYRCVEGRVTMGMTKIGASLKRIAYGLLIAVAPTAPALAQMQLECRPFPPPTLPDRATFDPATLPAAGDVVAFLNGKTNDCVRCDLKGAQLQRRALAGADLRGADLSGASLHAAVLSKARLDGARLTGANLDLANLSAASLVTADLQDALLYRANLSGALLNDANLTNARLSEA